MEKRIDVPHAARGLLSAQSGVLSLDQALRLGMSEQSLRRLVAQGHWYRIAPGIVADTPRLDWDGWCWAGVIRGDGVLGGPAAGHLHGLVPQPDDVVVWTERQLRPFGPVTFRRGVRSGRGDPPRPSLEVATIDLCEEADEAAAVGFLTAALRGRRTTVRRLREEVESRPTFRGRRLLLAVLADVAVGVESPLERAYLTYVERAHHLPTGVRQRSVSVGTRSDVLYEEWGVLVELDGRVWHEGMAVERDRMRDNAHLLLGLPTLRFGWTAVTRDPCAVADQVATALAQRGWSGLPRACRRCKRRKHC